jgi:hypothetical protein
MGQEVDVAPTKVRRLARAQAREGESCHQGAAAVGACRLPTVEFGGGVEQGDDLAGRVQVPDLARGVSALLPAAAFGRESSSRPLWRCDPEPDQPTWMASLP